jgi:alpha-L-fucosidase
VELNLFRIREDIRLGQRVTGVQVDGWVEGHWTMLAKATSVGACRLILLDKPATTKKIRVHLSTMDACPVISEVGMFLKK